MKRKTLLLTMIVACLLMTSFWAVNVYTATNCFTDTSGLKTSIEKAICWMKANRLASGSKFKPNDPVTRSQAALWLQKASQIPPTTGNILISTGFGDLRPFESTDDLSFTYLSSFTSVRKATVGTNFLSIHPSIPTVLYGRSLQLVGVEFCYSASVNAALSAVEINTYTHTAGPGSRDLRFTDTTARTDIACQYYVLPTPVTLKGEDGVNFFIQGNWTIAGTSLGIGRTTFVLRPTDAKADGPAAVSGKEAVLMQEGGPVPVEGPTNRP